MAYSSQDSDDIISGINVTPLVDIVLVILIIFIVTASMVFKNAIQMKLPEAQSAEQSQSGLLNLAITAEGKLFINGQDRPLEQLPGAIDEVRSKLAAEGRAEQKLTAFVAADVNAQYGKFAQVVDRLRVLGVTDIALDTQPVQMEQKMEQEVDGT